MTGLEDRAEQDRLCAPSEIADMTSLSESTLGSWRFEDKHRDEKVGPPYFHLGARVVYRLSEVRAWIAAREQGES